MLKVLVPTPITAAMLVSTSASTEPSSYEPNGTGTALWSATASYSLNQYVYYDRRVWQASVSHTSVATSANATVTMTIAAPCVVTWSSAHGLNTGASLVLTTNGVLPTGLTNGGTYYVTVTSATQCNLSATLGGTAITTTGTQSGVHTASVTTTQPDLSVSGSNPRWIYIGPTNKWAVFDTYINTATRYTGTLTTVVTPGVCNGVAVLDMSGVASVTVSMVNGVDPVFTETQTLDNSFISDWYAYFFEPFDIKSDILFGPLPPYPSAQVTVTVVPDSGGTVSVGAVMYGNTVELGQVHMGATAGITDYSRKETDTFGQVSLVERSFAKRANYTLTVANAQIRRVFSTLAALRATPAVWVASDDYSYSPLTVFGWPEDWDLNVQYSTYSTVSLKVQGLT